MIEDEATIAEAVAARLRSEDYAVEIAVDGPSGVQLVERLRPDLVVLDLMLPGLDGLEVCRRIQTNKWVPVLMLTARDTEEDIEAGLAAGADDYLSKPFSARELAARVAALLRRSDRAAMSRPDALQLRIGDLTLEPQSRRVENSSGLVHLTPTEFDLVYYLASRPTQVASRDELLLQVWGYEIASGGRTVDSHVRSIRRKLGASTIRTVHGIGYAVDQ